MTIIGAFLIGALIAFVSLVSEYGMGLERQNKDQRIADLASFAAANYYMANSTDGNVMASATSVAQNVAALNGVPGSDVQVNLVTSPTNASANAIKVKVTTAAPLFLAKLVGGGTSLTDSASSYAQVVSGPGNGCVLSLNNSAVDDLWANGNTTLNLKNCDIYDNSSSSAALSVGGSASVTVRSAYIVGGVYGSSKINASGTVQTGASRTQDPYRSVDIPAYTGCDHTSYSTTTNATLNPGVYCNGFQITSHAVVTLNPGLYIFDRGAFSISGQATLQGATVNGVSGVTLVFTSSTGSSWPTVTINGGATVNLTAPTTADIKAGNNGLNGILFYGDRNMPVGTAFKINGGSSQTLTGAIYLPEAAINYSGTTDVNNACLQLIGDTITFIGTSNVAISGCGQFALRTFGAPLDNSQNKVGLVE
ncbi:hypothetical protein K9U39_07700 [Rhodoblastus acidophilus]|uniref:Flp pilus-assembly TadG-like N-terminal domain-containing protein n=1 Tax=Candidatus Rhodoblastus alkanivorans TaxID=2954117 RepID=A0ABS9Z774_9HYPH|nr:hypothetical protein [Candidatus Rhodoblastus alkanivorans]MCI4678690.1 hypothetical protein [Candidatus Rhodoblastus alkanivorans]MCI4683514.1 hypothetical protein [Candidatus Rhodoblastus alkanivorans]MDI4640829.1 hypothetical protein [Rhodoblastus acidophilus]